MPRCFLAAKLKYPYIQWKEEQEGSELQQNDKHELQEEQRRTAAMEHQFGLFAKSFSMDNVLRIPPRVSREVELRSTNYHAENEEEEEEEEVDVETNDDEPHNDDDIIDVGREITEPVVVKRERVDEEEEEEALVSKELMRAERTNSAWRGKGSLILKLASLAWNI